MSLTLLVHKQTAGKKNFYYTSTTLNPYDFNSEQELIKRIYRECGKGSFYMNISRKGRKGLSEAYWKGEINYVSDTVIAYTNVIDEKMLENELGIRQRSPMNNHQVDLI